MPQIISIRPRAATAGALFLVLASLALAACGGSSSSSSSTNASASSGTTSTGAAAAGPGSGRFKAGRFKALRTCLQKDGITLPQRIPGQPPPSGAGGFLGGGAGRQLPKGVTRAQYEDALKKCGGAGRFFGGGSRLNSPTFTKALAKFAACMRQNGVNVPGPNTSGSGPIFSTKGLNASSTKFRTAEARCRSNLPGAFRTGPGAG